MVRLPNCPSEKAVGSGSYTGREYHSMTGLADISVPELITLSDANQVKTLNVAFDQGGLATLFKFKTHNGRVYLFKTTAHASRELAYRVAGSAKRKNWEPEYPEKLPIADSDDKEAKDIYNWRIEAFDDALVMAFQISFDGVCVVLRAKPAHMVFLAQAILEDHKRRGTTKPNPPGSLSAHS